MVIHLLKKYFIIYYVECKEKHKSKIFIFLIGFIIKKYSVLTPRLHETGGEKVFFCISRIARFCEQFSMNKMKKSDEKKEKNHIDKRKNR